MAHEITPWIAPDCDLTLRVSNLSSRESFSREINEEYGEGGGLNANYATVDAIAKVSNMLGKALNLEYGSHFVFKTSGVGTISLDFANERTRDLVKFALGWAVVY
jgi:hypothetical protein